MSFNGIAFTIAMFVHATALARGVSDYRMAATATVPVEDMRAASSYAVQIHQQVSEIYRNAGRIRWPATSRALVADVLGRAVDATQRLAREADDALARARGEEVPSLKSGLITFGVQEMLLAQEFLEVASGERTLSDSILAGMDAAITEQVLLMTPVIGECVMAFEAVVGRRVVEFSQKLTPAERAMRGLGILLPRALGYVGGRIIPKAVLVTRRAFRLACESAKVYRIIDDAISSKLFIQMAVSLRTVSEAEFKEFVELLMAVVKDVNLTYDQKTRLGYFMFRMSARTRQALWLSIVERELGKSLSGVQLLKNASLSAGELQTLRRFNIVAKKPVVVLPKTQPAQYPLIKEVQGARHPDGILDGELFDLITSSENSTVDKIVESYAKKDSQATKVLNALTESKVGIDEVSNQMHNVWASPKTLNIDTVILFDGTRIITHTRPLPYIAPFAAEQMRLLSGQAVRLIRAVNQVESEPR